MLNTVLTAPRQIVINRIMKCIFKFPDSLTLKSDDVSCIDDRAGKHMILVVILYLTDVSLIIHHSFTP